VAVALIPGLPGAPPCEEIEAAIRDALIDRVFIVAYDGSPSEANALLERLANLAVDATLLPNLQGLHVPFVRAAQIGMLSAVDVAARPLPSPQALLKRGEDLIFATFFILAALPLMLLIAIAIKVGSRGPVFFRQTRLGFHDKPFELWKFRTMYAEQAGNGPLIQTGRNDPRITGIGRFLRRTSLDELPQFFNVLRGEMSVVGPRPHATTMTAAGRPLQAVLAGYASRHRVRPGLTGWAQINGCRGEVNTEEKLRKRVALDCYYIEHWSMALDLKIILCTAAFLAFDRNAY
jgi:exopolysaccharide biosynthesis polyprenyl glycosylphosphotransferase